MPDRDPLRDELDALIVRFWQRGITPVISTNGRHADADIEITKVSAKEATGPDHLKHIHAVTITARGQERLDAGVSDDLAATRDLLKNGRITSGHGSNG